MSKGTTRRTVRIEDDLWEEAQVIARENGSSLSEIIRRALVKYIDDKSPKCTCDYERLRNGLHVTIATRRILDHECPVHKETKT